MTGSISPPTTAPTDTVAPVDLDDVRIATDPPDRLAPFNLAGVLAPADIHAARTLCRLVGEDRADVLLAVALTVRAPRHSHVCVELGSVRDHVTGVDEAPIAVEDLDWPDPSAWRELLSDSPIVTVRPPGTPDDLDPSQDRPLSLVEDRLYLDRYWRYERRVAEVLRRRAQRVHEDVDPERVREALDRLLPAGEQRPDLQRLAVASGVLRALTVIAGGPGTGKTFTVARVLALAHELSGGAPRVAVAAPTGKAADRMTAAIRAAAATIDTSLVIRDRLRSLEGTTIHRLLGWHPDPTRFRHGQGRELPHQLVVIDETSMVDLPLMAKLLVALRREATLVLVGDPDQLASVEAGTVLADVVGPAGGEGPIRMSDPTRRMLAAATGEPLDEVSPPRPGGIDDAVLTLGGARRYQEDSGIADLARAIHSGHPDEVLTALRTTAKDVVWLDTSGDAEDGDRFASIRTALANCHRQVVAAARGGDADAALAALDRVRVLCAHRYGPAGVSRWLPFVESWLAADVEGFDPSARWYVGRPLLVTQNEPRLHLFNGDVGVVVRDGHEVAAAFPGPDGVRRLGPSRLEYVETVHAMTIHKSQGSEFDHVAVILPDAESPILTRELLYTAATRARRQLTVVGTEPSIRAAVTRRIARAAGLREALWGA